ncbi:hypothetical protein D3C77_503120 [compost metagenome]
MVLGFAEDQHPAVIGQQFQPAPDRLGHPRRIAAQLTEGVATAVHALASQFECGLFRLAGLSQCAEQGVQIIQGLQAVGEFGTGCAAVVQQPMQGREVAFHGLASTVRYGAGERCTQCCGGGQQLAGGFCACRRPTE